MWGRQFKPSPQAARCGWAREHEAAAAPRCSGSTKPFADSRRQAAQPGQHAPAPSCSLQGLFGQGTPRLGPSAPLRTCAPPATGPPGMESTRTVRKPAAAARVRAAARRLVAGAGAGRLLGKRCWRRAGGVGAGCGGRHGASGAGGRRGHDGRRRRRWHCAAHRVRALAASTLHATSWRSLRKQCLQRRSACIRAGTALQRDSGLHQPTHFTMRPQLSSALAHIRLCTSHELLGDQRCQMGIVALRQGRRHDRRSSSCQHKRGQSR